jgi:hypothetical protein
MKHVRLIGRVCGEFLKESKEKGNESCGCILTLKDKLKNSKIEFIDRDIDIYDEEYSLFVDATNSYYVPAFIVINSDMTSELFAPERDYNTIDEAFEIIKKMGR